MDTSRPPEPQRGGWVPLGHGERRSSQQMAELYASKSDNLQWRNAVLGPCLDLTFATGVVNCVRGLTVAGQPVAREPWIAGHFDCGPPVVNVNVTGQCPWTVTRDSTGVYVVTFGEQHPRGDSYTVLATIPAGGFVMWDKTATSLTLNTKNTSGQAADVAEVNFTTIP